MKTVQSVIHSFAISCFILVTSLQLQAQCPSGSIGVTGTGCGCATSCNLTAFGGPNCSGVTGNCSAGQVSMSVNITVPAGCTITVNATMSNRAGTCTASGADSGDQMKVDALGGSKSFQTGAANATLNDSYVLVGPGTIRVSGTANRADEIITYSASSIGCINCTASLPVELLRFDAQKENETVACMWETESELNNDYFIVERSIDGITFESIGTMEGNGTTTQLHTYKLYDSSPYLNGISYYRLTQVDVDGTTHLSEMKSVNFIQEPEVSIFPNPSSGQLTIIGKHLETTDIVLYNSLGQAIPMELIVQEDHIAYNISHLTSGLYMINYTENGMLKSEKIQVIAPTN